MTDNTKPEQSKAKHKPQDIYGNIHKKDETGASPLIHAATVVLLRDSDTENEIELLMLQKNTGISFGGMWVFPGGKIDQADYQEGSELEAAAKVAAARETEEETGLKVNQNDFVPFAHWTPPPGAPKRFATWFFAIQTQLTEDILVDGGEILSHRWISPAKALNHHKLGEIQLAPPTWLTLHKLSAHRKSADAIQQLNTQSPRIYETRIASDTAGVHIAMWEGDAGYESWDANKSGDRHRLLLKKDGYIFEDSKNFL